MIKGLQFTQIAIRVPSISKTKCNLNNMFDVMEWTNDKLKMDGEMNGRHSRKIPLDLSFNYELLRGFEFELIDSKDSLYHWHKEIIRDIGDVPFLSHLGAYCDRKTYYSVAKLMSQNKIKVLQDTLSYDHTNRRVDNTKRQYWDMVFDTQDMLGFRSKITTRL